MKIKKKRVVLFFLLAAFFEPSFFNEVAVLDNLYFVAQLFGLLWAIVKLFGEKKIRRNDIFPILLVFGMHSMLLLSTIINNGSPIYDLKKMALDVGFMLVVINCLKDDYKLTVDVVLDIFIVITAVNLWSLFAFFERGMFVGRDGMIQYFWSVDNHFSSILFPMVMMSWVNSVDRKTRVAKIKNYVAIAIAIVTSIAAWSGTTIVGGIIFIFGIISHKFVLKHEKLLNYYWLVPLAFLLQILIVNFNIQDNMQFLLDFLGKNATLSYRTRIWEYALAIIQNSPFIGLGSPGAFDRAGWFYNEWQGNLFMHNEFLELWVDGGIFAMLFFIALLVGAILVNRKYKNHANNVLFIFFLCSLLCMMITETVTPRNPMYFVLVLVYGKYIYNEEETVKFAKKSTICRRK